MAGPLESYDPSNDKTKLDLPRRPEGASEGEKTGEVTEPLLDQTIESIEKDHSIDSAEEMYVWRIARTEQQRLRQNISHSSDAERELSKVRSENMKRNLQIVQWTKALVRQYRTIQKRTKQDGVRVKLDAAVEKNANDHLQAFVETTDQLVAFKNFRMLQTRRMEKKDVSAEELQKAVAALLVQIDGELDGKPATARIDHDALLRLSPEAALADPELMRAELMLDRRIEILFSYQPGTPGASQERPGENPLDIFLASYMDAASMASLQEELRLGAEEVKSVGRDKRIAAQAKFREYIVDQEDEYQQGLLKHFLGGTERITIGMFDTAYGGDARKPPENWAEFVRNRPDFRNDMDESWQQFRGAMTSHRKDVDAVFRLRSSDVKETAYKFARFHGVIQFVDSLARLNAVPKVVRNRITRLIGSSTVGENVTDYLSPEVTFRNEAHKALEKLRVAWQLPDVVTVERDGKKIQEKFNPWSPSHWEAIPQEQWDKINRRIQTTREVLKQHEEKLQGNEAAAGATFDQLDDLRKIRHPLELMDVKPSQDLYNKLVSKEVTVADLLKDKERLKANPDQLAAIWLFLTLEFRSNMSELARGAHVAEKDLVGLAEEKAQAHTNIWDMARDWDWTYFAMFMAAWWARGVILSRKHQLLINKIPYVQWGYRGTVGAGFEMGKDLTYRAPRQIGRIYKKGKNVIGRSAERLGLIEINPERLRLRAQTLGKELDAIEALNGPKRLKALEKFKKSAIAFQRDLNQLCETMPGARRMIAAEVLGREISVGSDFWKMIEETHALEGTERKLARLLGSPEELKVLTRAERLARMKEANRLMRLGITGGEDIAVIEQRLAREITQLGKSEVTVGVRTTERITESLTQSLERMGFPGDSRKIMRLMENGENAKLIQEAFQASGKRGANRAAQYILGLEGAKGATGAVRDAKVILRVAQGMDDPLIAAKLLARMNEAGTLTAEKGIQQLNKVASRGGRLLTRTLTGLGAAIDAGMVVYDFIEKNAALNALKQVRNEKIEQLRALCKQLPESIEETGDGVFEFKGLKNAKIEIKDIATLYNEDDERSAWNSRIGVDAGAGVFFLGAAIAGTGPIALLAIPVVIGAHVAIDAHKDSVDRGRRREFINNAPVWLLGFLSTMDIIGMDELGLVRENAPTGAKRKRFEDDNFHGSLKPTPEETQREVARRKTVQALAYRELSQNHPDLCAEIVGNPQEFFSEDSAFLKKGGDFDAFVQPFVALQLQARTKMQRQWFVRTSRGINVLDNEITHVPFRTVESMKLSESDYGNYIENRDLANASRRGMLFYAQHLRELNYREKITSLNKLAGGEKELFRSFKEEFDAGIVNDQNWTVFGRHPREFPLQGETWAQKLLRENLEAVRSAPDAQSSENVARSGPYKLPDGAVHSLEDFTKDILESKEYRPMSRLHLKRYAEQNHDLPLGFEEMEKMDKTQLQTSFEAKIQPIYGVDEALENCIREKWSQESLRKIVQEQGKNFDLYTAIEDHKVFYWDYFSYREAHVSSLPEDRRHLLRLIQKWQHQWDQTGAEPVVLDENALESGRKESGDLRFKRLITPAERFALRLPRERIAGEDILNRRKGQQVWTLDGFLRMYGRLSSPKMGDLQSERFDLTQRALGESAIPPPFRLNPTFGQPRAETENSRGEPLVHDINNVTRPLSSFGNLSNCIAVHASRVPALLRSIQMNDGLYDLRMLALKQRVFVLTGPGEPDGPEKVR